MQMDFKSENIILSGKYKWLWHSLYWFLAALLLFFVFSNRDYDLRIRGLVVVAITLMSFGLTFFINYYLIPKFLFVKKYFRFIYFLFSAILISIWINYLSIFYILWYTEINSPQLKLPGNQDVILLISGSYIIILFAAFIHFIKESYVRLIERDRIAGQKAETELKLKEAKLRLLQGQLHPHFLFNMLNNLYGLWMENSKSTPDVILKLSDLLDYMLYECDKEKIPLQNEIRFIHNYVDLEVLRHDNRLKPDIQLPDNNCGKFIAPLILFSFVENAFKHGVNKIAGDSYISINLSIKGNILEFTVINNFNPDESVNNRESRGVGLKNVEERLNLLYSGKHKLTIENENCVFKVILMLELD